VAGYGHLRWLPFLFSLGNLFLVYRLARAWAGPSAGGWSAFILAGISRGGKLTIPRGRDMIQPDDTIFVVIMREMLPLFLPMVNRRVNEVERAVIYGAGTTGRRLAQVLETKLERVCLIDPSPDRTEVAAAVLKHATVLCGEATDLDLLREAAIDRADAFVALSDDDQSNRLAALLARRQGANRLVVQASETDYVPVLQSIGIDSTINPRLVTVGAILEHIRRGRVRSVVKLADSEAEAIELSVAPESEVVGKQIHELQFPADAIIAALARAGQVMIPKGDTVLRPGDSAVVLALPNAIPRIERLFAGRKP
jgi:trk system potassium uptake protein TrkA